jgi:hypothetical protein
MQTKEALIPVFSQLVISLHFIGSTSTSTDYGPVLQVMFRFVSADFSLFSLIEHY